MKLLRKQISVCIFFWFSLSCKDIVDFHCTVMRPVLEYCSPIFHHSLPDCLSERVQKRALSIIAPDKSCKHCLVSFGLSTLYDRRNDQCIQLFNRVFSHDVTAAILVSQNNETAAMLVSQTSPVGIELLSYANDFFCFNKFAQMLAT